MKQYKMDKEDKLITIMLSIIIIGTIFAGVFVIKDYNTEREKFEEFKAKVYKIQEMRSIEDTFKIPMDEIKPLDSYNSLEDCEEDCNNIYFESATDFLEACSKGCNRVYDVGGLV